MRLQPVIYALGVLLILIGLAMIPCAILDTFERRDDWAVFALSSFAIVSSGGVLYMASGGKPGPVGTREAFLLTVSVWVFLPFAAALPFMGAGLDFTDAIFESISGVTTTGATVITGLDAETPGLLLWRAILQWIGGIGIIVTAIAILPMLGVGGMQLFQLEFFDMSGKFLPSVREIAKQIALVYIGLSVLCALLYALAGMTWFDAIAHAMTTMAAGGYSTSDQSFGKFADTPAVEVSIFFMILAGLPFGATVMMLHGRWDALWRDPQPRTFLFIIGASVILLTAYMHYDPSMAPFKSEGDVLRRVVFSVVTVITGTGYGLSDYGQWGGFAEVIFVALMFVGGCAGSAACGMKVFRIEIMARAVWAYARQLLSPNRIVVFKYGGTTIREDILQSVMVFVFMYLVTFAVAAVLLSLTGLDPLTSISAAATSISNVGPGLGAQIGPSGTFQGLSTTAKWICSAAMLMGRLELIPVFVVFTPRFWHA